MGCEAGYKKIPSHDDDVTAGHLIGCGKKSKILWEFSST